MAHLWILGDYIFVRKKTSLNFYFNGPFAEWEWVCLEASSIIEMVTDEELLTEVQGDWNTEKPQHTPDRNIPQPVHPQVLQEFRIIESICVVEGLGYVGGVLWGMLEKS